MSAGVNSRSDSLPGVKVPADAESYGDFMHGVTELMVASYRGEVDRVCQILSRDPQIVHRRNHYDVTALDYAVDARQRKVVDILFGYEADIDSLNSNGQNLLHRCVVSKQLDKVKMCLELGANVNSPSQEGDTALILAVKCHFDDIVAYLIKMDCDVTLVNRDGLSAMDYAFTHGYTKLRHLIQETINKTTNVNSSVGAILINECTRGNVLAIESMLSVYGDSIVHFQDSRNSNVTPLLIACRYGHLSAVNILYSHRASLNIPTVHGDTPLIYAAIFGKIEVLKWLIEKGAVINARNAYGRTALHCAVIEGKLQTVKILVENGILLNVRSDHGASALHLAIEKNFTDIVAYLAEENSFVDVKDATGDTPLVRAVISDKQDCILPLLEFGANIGSKNVHGLTSLTIAAHLGYLPVVKQLIQSGADIDFAAYKGSCITDIAFKNGSFDVYGYLRECSSVSMDQYRTGGNLLDSSLERRHYEDEVFKICDKGTSPVDQLSRLFKNGADVNARGIDGQTPLLLSVRKVNIVYVSWLLKHNADVDAPDNTGMTPLMYAAEMGHQQMVKMLVRNGANTLITDQQGRDVMEIVQKAQRDDILRFLKDSNSLSLYRPGEREFHSAVVNIQKETCQQLLRDGVNINCVDSQGRNALTWCLSDNSADRSELVTFLCKGGIDIDHKDNDGYSPIELYVTSGNVHLTRELIGFGVQLQNLLPGILIDAWASSESGTFAVLTESMRAGNFEQDYTLLYHFFVANMASEMTEMFSASDSHKLFQNGQFWAMCDEKVICRVIENLRLGDKCTEESHPAHHTLFKVGVERNLPDVMIALRKKLDNRGYSERGNFVDKERPIQSALSQGHYEVAAKMTNTTILVLGESSTKPCRKDKEKCSTLEDTVHYLETLWVHTLNTVYKAVIHRSIRYYSHNVAGISRNVTNTSKPVLHFHTRDKRRLSMDKIKRSLTNIPNSHVYQAKIIEQKNLASLVTGLCLDTKCIEGHYWIRLNGLKNSEQNTESLNILVTSVHWFCEHSGITWFLTTPNSLPLEGVHKGYGRTQCRCVLAVRANHEQKDLVLFRGNSSVYYVNNYICDTKTISLVAVPLECSRNSIPLQHRYRYVYEGSDDAMIGRKVIKSGIGGVLCEGEVMEANVSCTDDQGDFYHGVFVIRSNSPDQPFASDGDHGAAVIDADSKLVLGLVLATHKDYMFACENRCYGQVTIAVPLSHAVKFMHDTFNVKLATFRTF